MFCIKTLNVFRRIRPPLKNENPKIYIFKLYLCAEKVAKVCQQLGKKWQKEGKRGYKESRKFMGV